MIAKKKAFIKALTYRIAGFAASSGLAFIFFGRLDIALGFAILESVVKIILYYVHERIWERGAD